MFEAIFECVLKEKSEFYDKRKASPRAWVRLEHCAKALRMGLSRGSAKFGRRTVLAVVDHITQVLPGPHDDFVTPLVTDYIKSLTSVLSRQAIVELLARQDGAAWEVCVDFFLDIAHHFMPQVANSTNSRQSRDSETPRGRTSRNTAKLDSSSNGQKVDAHSVLGGVLEGLHSLVRGSNAPVLRRSKEVTDTALQTLRAIHSTPGAHQTVCFAIVSVIFSAIQTEEIDDATALVRELIPLMAHWWRPEKVSQDELIRALRNEISKFMVLAQLHLEYIGLNNDGSALLSSLEDLAEPRWLEYSKRSDAFRLQLDDLTFSVSNLPKDYLCNSLFGLRPHNMEGESHWILVQNLAFLESTLLRSSNVALHHMEGERPAKKMRTRQTSIRIKQKLESTTIGVRLTALQLLPFMFANGALKADEVGEILQELVRFAADKDPSTASWAMIACARYDIRSS
jgi:serine-protein kinase ATM